MPLNKKQKDLIFALGLASFLCFGIAVYLFYGMYPPRTLYRSLAYKGRSSSLYYTTWESILTAVVPFLILGTIALVPAVVCYVRNRKNNNEDL